MSSKGRPLLTLPYTAEAAVKRQRFVSAGAADDKVKPAAANAAVVGVADRPASADNPVDVHVLGAVPVVYGGVVARGDRVVSDAEGRAVALADVGAVPAAPDLAGVTAAELQPVVAALQPLGARANVHVAGVALKSGVAGDIGSIVLSAS